MAEHAVEMTPEEQAAHRAAIRKQRWILAGIIAGLVLFLAGIGAAVYFLLQPGTPTGAIRDIFIILVAFESLILGAALVVLIVQVASLINLVQNEVRPILQATSEAVSTLRGTTQFLSENLVEPVVKLNSYLAGLRKVFNLFGPKRR